MSRLFALTIGISLAAFAAAQPPQHSPPRQLPLAITQAGHTEASNSPVARPTRDLSKLPPIAQQIYWSAQRGSEWFYRANQPTGRFLPGWDPSLNQPSDADHFVSQAAATAALARAARFYKNDGYTVRASQAILTLLAETGPDPREPTSRCTSAPSSEVNKLSACGMLLAAIHELPNPASELLDRGEELARYIVRQQRTDGSLMCSDLASGEPDFESSHVAPGIALTGLMRSQALRPAPWKIDVMRKAVAYYRPWWRDHRHMTFAANMAPACAVGFLQSKDRARDIGMAEFACELSDWLCTQQIDKLDPRHPNWMGGFAEKPGQSPTISGLACASAIIETARVTRQLPDAERFARYRDAATAALQFGTTLQYTDANTQHFGLSYRQQFLLGGFHMAHNDGRLRMDGTPQAVAGMLAYLMVIADM
jgi:hypothetical protein